MFGKKDKNKEKTKEMKEVKKLLKAFQKKHPGKAVIKDYKN